MMVDLELVHGEHARKKKDRKRWTPAEIVETTDRTEEYLRDALVLCLSNPGEPRVDSIDKAIAAGDFSRGEMKEIYDPAI